MKRILILTLAAGLLSVGTPAVMAQVSTNTPAPNVTQHPDASKRQQERRQLLKILDLTPQELKGLSPQERRSKLKEATEQKISLLQQKKAAGTISAEEQSNLTFLEKYQQRGKKKAASDS